jgi:hypothetical protein
MDRYDFINACSKRQREQCQHDQKHSIARCTSCVVEEALERLAQLPEATALTRYDMHHYEGEPGVAAEPSPTGEWVRWSDIAGSMNRGGDSK